MLGMGWGIVTDYREIAKALRRKAESSEFPAESEALLKKAIALEELTTKDPKDINQLVVTVVNGDKWQTKIFTQLSPDDWFPNDWYETMDEWGDTSDWYSGAE